MFDLIIRNAVVYDGTGKPGFGADVAIAKGKIAEVAERDRRHRNLHAEAKTVIDATGRLLIPGFVDVHSHSDFNILANPQAESKLRQGITTEVVGNCGSAHSRCAALRWPMSKRRTASWAWSLPGARSPITSTRLFG